MDRADYDRYVAAFNGRDYDRLLTFFTPDVVLETVGREIVGHQGIRDFYRFFHEHVLETVRIRRFWPGADAACAQVVIAFEGITDLTQAMLDERGFGGMEVVPAGVRVEVEFLIVYLLTPEGLIHRVRCGTIDPILG